MRARSVAVLVGAGRRVVAEGKRERQQVSLRRAPVVVHQQVAEPSVEALVLAQDLVRTGRPEREGDGERDDEGQPPVQGDELIDALDDPVGEGIDVPPVRGSGVVEYRWPSASGWSRSRALRRREGGSKRCERHMSRFSRAHLCRFVVSIVHGPLCSLLCSLVRSCQRNNQQGAAVGVAVVSA